ncbi:hypothetical protein GC209_19275 [bacterium]|nr:hypothetical protein [bacterium]
MTDRELSDRVDELVRRNPALRALVLRLLLWVGVAAIGAGGVVLRYSVAELQGLVRQQALNTVAINQNGGEIKRLQLFADSVPLIYQRQDRTGDRMRQVDKRLDELGHALERLGDRLDGRPPYRN